METPITKKFFENLELYLELKKQNKRSQKSSEGKKMWSMEKAILKWAVVGHWHRGSPLPPDFLQDRLREQKFPEEWIKDIRKVAQNLISRGFAYHPKNETDPDTIQLTKEGFSFGEIIEETESSLTLKIPSTNRIFYWLTHIFLWLILIAGGINLIKPAIVSILNIFRSILTLFNL